MAKDNDDMFCDDVEVFTAGGAGSVIVSQKMSFTPLKAGDTWAPRVNPDGSGKSATLAFARLTGPELAAIIAEAMGLPAGKPYTLNGTVTLGIKREGLKAEVWAKAQAAGAAHKAKQQAAQAKAKAAAAKGL